MGDRLGIPDAVSFSFTHLLPPFALFGRTWPPVLLLLAKLTLTHLISSDLEAKQGPAWLVLGWENAWEYQVL